MLRGLEGEIVAHSPLSNFRACTGGGEGASSLPGGPLATCYKEAALAVEGQDVFPRVRARPSSGAPSAPAESAPAA